MTIRTSRKIYFSNVFWIINNKSLALQIQRELVDQKEYLTNCGWGRTQQKIDTADKEPRKGDAHAEQDARCNSQNHT